jgi:hypothetical protein
MPALAMGRHGVLGGRTDAAQGVLPRRYGLEMRGVYAPRITAEMIELWFQNRAD